MLVGLDKGTVEDVVFGSEGGDVVWIVVTLAMRSLKYMQAHLTTTLEWKELCIEWLIGHSMGAEKYSREVTQDKESRKQGAECRNRLVALLFFE